MKPRRYVVWSSSSLLFALCPLLSALCSLLSALCSLLSAIRYPLSPSHFTIRTLLPGQSHANSTTSIAWRIR